ITADNKGANVFLAYLASNAEAEAAMSNPEEAIANGLVVQLGANDTALKTTNGDFAKEDAFVAEVKGDKYVSLENALAAAEDNDTVKLLKNVALTDGVNVDKKITLDLNGYTITTNDDNWT